MTAARGYVDPVLVALSDALVLTALERVVSRCLPRSVRGYHLAPEQRHSAYVDRPIREERLDAALAGAWVLCPALAERHGVDADPTRWAALLDGYVRALLLACEPHDPARLRPHLAPLAVAERWTRPYAAVSA